MLGMQYKIRYEYFHSKRYSYHLASYPGLLTPAFVTCSTDAGEGLVKLSHMQ